MVAESRDVVRFDPATHTYSWRGRDYPSVTQVLRRAGVYSAYDAVDPAVLKRAAIIGQNVHTAIHLFHFLGIEPYENTPSECHPRIEAYERFLNDTGYEVIETEVAGINTGHGYAGTLDSVGWLNGLRTLVELKTTRSINRPAVELQTAAYEPIWEIGMLALPKLHAEWPRGAINQRLALHLKPDGYYSIIPCKDKLAWHRFVSYIG